MSRLENIKDFFKNHQDKIILTIGFILVCTISFAAGRLSATSKSEPITIDESNIFENIETKNENEEENKENIAKNNEESNVKIENEGVFVGNIENNKFYPFNSEEVGDISSDNTMWFDSKEEAEGQGYILAENTSTERSSKTSTEETSELEVETDALGKYVGSKNSDKYHTLDSGSAKRIKEENKVYFKSKEEAENKGYTAGSSVKD